ncbi:MAG: hypothetical protein F6K14_08325 [Symploca sp. SIO2C1]|nr:hypothetical protein [Symploca sp. SIO2C1]
MSEWSPVDESRDWQCVAERWRCQKLAQKRKQALVDIKATGDSVLKWACIFKNKEH